MKSVRLNGTFAPSRARGLAHLWGLTLLSSLSMLWAQVAGTGTIRGTVTDPSGAVIPGATVVATNVATGVETRRQTTEAGLYVIAPLPAGVYTVSASAPGFRTVVQERVVVDALATVVVDLTLQLGETTESVTVSAAPPELNAADARLGQTMRNEMYTALPLSMGGAPRNPQAFAFLLPGVQEGGRWGYISGGQSFSKDVYIEGLPATDAVQQGEGRYVSLAVSVESVEQFQVETSGQSVEYNGQGSENYVLKSGTNELHGSLFEYFRNTVLDARGFFAPKRSPQNQNEFGFTLGGPIIRNKLFFFGTYDGYRYRVGTDYRFVTVPTLKMREGDFSELPKPIYDPLTTQATAGGFSRSPFPGNRIPGSRLSPISLFFQEPLPAPTHPGITSNFLNNNKGVGYNNEEINLKIDYNVTDAHRFSGVMLRGKRSQASAIRGNPDPLPLPYTNTRVVEEIPTTAQLKHTWVLTPSLLNQASFGFARLYVPITNPTIGGRWAERAGLKGLPPGDASLSFPETSFSGPNSPTNWRGTDSRPFLDALNNFTVQDSLQWVHGAHAFKWGFQMQRLQDNYRARMDGSLFIARFSNAQTAGFTSKGTLDNTTGHAYASYLLGALNSSSVIEDFVVTSGARFRNYAVWFQDDWKVTSRLTLNLGLRWDLMLPYVEVCDRQSWLNPDIPNPAVGGYRGALQFAGKGPSPLYSNTRTNIKTHYKNFGPRLGLAYRLTDSTVIRAAYGVMYSRHGAVGGRAGARDGTGKLGYSAEPGFSSLDGFSPAFWWDQGIPPYDHPPFIDLTVNTGFYTGKPSGGSITYGDTEIGARPPRYQNWNFSIQQSLGPDTTLTIAYAGSNGHYLRGGGRGIWSNQIHPRYLVLGNLLQAQATPANLAAARQIIPDLQLPYPNFVGTIGQMLRPFPQYSSIGDPYGNIANSNYNSLQVTLRRRMSAGLTFNINYTWSKTLTDGEITGRSAYFWKIERGEVNQPHVLNATFVYELPFGRRHRLSPGNRALRAMVSDWRLSGITRVRSGDPYGRISASCNVPYAGTCNADYNRDFQGSVRIGKWGEGDLLGARPAFLDKNAFKNPAPYTYGDTPPTGAYGLYNPWFWNQDLSVMRRFRVTERFVLNFQADAFNVFNTVIFSGPASLDINSSNFGRITSQQNSPRTVQLSLKLTF